jgi:hypothetical protein
VEVAHKKPRSLSRDRGSFCRPHTNKSKKPSPNPLRHIQRRGLGPGGKCLLSNAKVRGCNRPRLLTFGTTGLRYRSRLPDGESIFEPAELARIRSQTEEKEGGLQGVAPTRDHVFWELGSWGHLLACCGSSNAALTVSVSCDNWTGGQPAFGPLRTYAATMNLTPIVFPCIICLYESGERLRSWPSCRSAMRGSQASYLIDSLPVR